jgi:hypothetical protein
MITSRAPNVPGGPSAGLKLRATAEIVASVHEMDLYSRTLPSPRCSRFERGASDPQKR